MATYLYLDNGTATARLTQQQVASLALALSLLGNHIRQPLASVLGEHGKPFVRFLRAKGAGPVRIGPHILRNATATLTAATLEGILTTVMLNISVLDYVLDVEGITLASLPAVEASDVSLAVSTRVSLS